MLMCVNTFYIYIFTSNIHPHMSDTCKGGNTDVYKRNIINSIVSINIAHTAYIYTYIIYYYYFNFNLFQ